MTNTLKSKTGLTRREFIGRTAASAVGMSILPSIFSCSSPGAGKPNSKFGGVQIGAITYSWRSMPSSARDILNYCIEAGISSIELMGNVAEEFAGIPPMPARPPRDADETVQEKFRNDAAAAREKQREWRLSTSMEKYKELRGMFNNTGINLHIVKFAPAGWSDEEIDYAFESAKVLGAKGITNEVGTEAAMKLGKFAEKHNLFAIYHNHGQPGDPNFSFDEFLSYSPKNMLNFDVGHYFGATGRHPNEILERLHDRIFSIHLKDKTAKDATPADTNMPWGEGDTPVAEILKLIQKNKWQIYCDIELEYQIPENSDAQKEIIKCVEFCRNILR